MEPLTRRQQDTLHYIADARAARGASPKLREIASAFSISIGSVYHHLSALRRKGYLTIDTHVHRGIRLTRSRRDWKIREGWRGDFEKRFGERLRAVTDLAGLFDMVSGEFPAWLEVERADLFVYDAGRRKFRDRTFYASRPAGVADPNERRTPPDAFLASAVRRRKPAVEAGRAVFPVLGRDRALGILHFEDARPGAIDEIKTARAALASAALVPALERATLDAELRHRIRLQSALVALCRTVNGGGDLLNILRDIYTLVGRLVDTTYFNIATKDDAGQWWMLLERDEIDGKPWEYPGIQRAEIHTNEALQAIRTEPFYIMHRTPEEVRSLEAKDPGHLTADGWGTSGNLRKRSRSILYVPLRSGGEWIGYISAQSYQYNAYSIRDAEDLILIGEYIGLAVQDVWRRDRERAELEALRKKVADLERRLS